MGKSLVSCFLRHNVETDHTNRPSFSLLTLHVVTFRRLEVLPFPPVRLTVNCWLLINLTSVKYTGAKADFLPIFSSNMPLTFRFHRTVGVSYRFGNIRLTPFGINLSRALIQSFAFRQFI